MLVLVGEAYGCDGGIARFNRNLIDALAAREDLELRGYGFHGAVGCGEPQGAAWRAPARAGKPGYAMTTLADAIRRRPDLVVCGLVGLGPLALAAARATGARLWSIVHGWEAWTPGPRLDNLALQRADLVTAVSRFTHDKLLSWARLPQARVQLLCNTIDLDRFCPGARPTDLAARLGLDGGRILLTVGRLADCDRYKGHDRVIRLLGRLRDRLGKVHYVVVGDGDDRPRLERLARDEGVAETVTFAGRVDEDDLVDLYRLADLFVMPSTGEGFGIVFLEALACGCPVIAGNRDGSVEAVPQGALGATIDPEDPDALAEAIEAALRTGRREGKPAADLRPFAIPAFRRRVDELLGELLAP